MSTDGTQPPSIAPKKAPAARTGIRSGTTTRGTEGRTGSGSRPVTAPLSGDAAPSIGERIKRTAQNVADATRTGGPTTTAEGGVPTAARLAPASGTSSMGDTSVGTGPAGPASVGTASAATTTITPSAARKVRLAVARIDPWSVMKLSFLLSVAIGIMLVVAAAVIWYTLDGLAVFTSVNNTIAEITGDTKFFDLLEYVAFKRVISLATMIAVVDVVILTALSTIGAFLYNIVAALVGGINVTLTDD